MELKFNRCLCDSFGFGLGALWWKARTFEMWPQFNLEIHLGGHLYSIELHFPEFEEPSKKIDYHYDDLLEEYSILAEENERLWDRLIEAEKPAPRAMAASKKKSSKKKSSRG